MTTSQWAGKQGELSALARFAVTKAWRLNTEWQRFDPDFRALMPLDFMRQVSGLFAIASYLWEEYGAIPASPLTEVESRQAKAHLN